MRITSILAATALAASATSASAQSSIANDVVAQMLMSGNQGRPSSCYNGRWTPSAESVAKGPDRVEVTMANYRQIATAGTDLRKAVGSEGQRRWQLDGQVMDARSVRDPFLPRVARLERLFVRSGNESAFYRVQWRAVAADGSEIGIYDGLMFWRSKKFMSLDLYTPQAQVRPVADTPFCQVPGDVEKWQEAKAESDARKAARNAAKPSSR